MILIRLTADDLTRIRFAFSPLWETVASIRALRTGAHLHLPWVRQVRSLVSREDLEVLWELVPPSGYIPDFLTPAPSRRYTSFGSGLTAVADTPPEWVAVDLAKLRHGRSRPLLDEMIDDPVEALSRITDALDRYWRLAIEPYWRRIRALLQDDLAYRLDELAGGGVERLFRDLHPSVRFDGKRIEITRPYSCEGSPLPGQGLLLVPCVFSWPAALSITAAPYLPTLTYPPRGIGRLWESQTDTEGSRLGDLIGKTRAAIVNMLDLPMTTTQLAGQLNLSAPTLSVHLGILKGAGVVDARRDGREVLYVRTDLGDHLLTGSRDVELLSA